MSLLNSGLKAVCRRQLGSLLGSPLGYVFILVFVFVVNQLCFLQDEFYKRNVADLAMLEDLMPWLLAVLISAISMNAWTLEREQGTEELLLTLPMRLFDAVLGKYLSIIIFFSVALCCSMSSVCVLWYLGEPDLGLLMANYLGWWFMGVSFAALALFASVSVSSQAISFVLSLVLCGIAILVGSYFHWGQNFARGLFSITDLGLSLACIIIGLSLALILLASRRWRSRDKSQRLWQVISLVAAVVCAVNVSRMAQRGNWNLDMSSEGLSSLSDASQNILADVTEPMNISVVVSETLPDELRVRGRELLDMCRALQQSMGSRLKLEIIRPDDPLTNAGRYVQDHLHMEARQTKTDTVAGRQSVSVFLGVHIQSGQVNQVLPYLEDGMSIEFELVRSIRAIDQRLKNKQKVIGIVSTEIELLEHFSQLSGEMKPAWQFVEELRKQYEVREVNPDNPIDLELDCLIVPLPSGLLQKQLEHVHDYIWQGGPTLLLSDPMPILIMEEYQRYGIAIAPSLPRYDRYASNTQKAAPKGDIQALYSALGVIHNGNEISWAQFKPDASLPQLPPEFVWLREDVGSFADVDVLAGLQTMMCIYPGKISKDPNTAMQVDSLIQIGKDVHWGVNPFTDYLKGSGVNLQFQTQVQRIKRVDQGPSLAVSIKGNMPRAFAADDNAVAALNAKPTNVIMLADLDFAHDRFFSMAKRMNQKSSSDFQKIWASIRNVQFLLNAVDSLVGDTDLLSLRRRQARYRSLERLDALRQETRDKKLATKESLEQKVLDKVASINAESDKKILENNEREDLDAHSRLNQAALLKKESDVYIQRYTDAQNKILSLAVRDAEIEERRILATYQRSVGLIAIGVPVGILFLVINLVLWIRRKRERRDIPANRLRSVV